MLSFSYMSSFTAHREELEYIVYKHIRVFVWRNELNSFSSGAWNKSIAQKSWELFLPIRERCHIDR